MLNLYFRFKITIYCNEKFSLGEISFQLSKYIFFVSNI